jgi:hypothetical protein
MMTVVERMDFDHHGDEVFIQNFFFENEGNRNSNLTLALMTTAAKQTTILNKQET